VTRKNTPPPIRSGVEKGARRRTIIDDRTGVVVDISQAGPDDRPQTLIELYGYPSGHHVVITELPGHNPWMAVSLVKDEEQT
jgi:hypothetical protein